MRMERPRTGWVACRIPGQGRCTIKQAAIRLFQNATADGIADVHGPRHPTGDNINNINKSFTAGFLSLGNTHR